MGYRVCIPTAGTGSRLGDMTKFVNKSLVSIANRPTICHIIEQFPADTEFVFALGHKGSLVREFLEIAYSERRFLFSNVQLFEGAGSGLGLSLMACKQYLNQPFIFSSCDTLVKGVIPPPDENWMGYAEVPDMRPYRTLEIDDSYVAQIAEKGCGVHTTHKAYIGLAGIHDYRKFWRAMENGGSDAIEAGEAQGMRALLPNKVKSYAFTWFDTGNLESLAIARDVFQGDDTPNILEKKNEAIWFLDNQVIKFSGDHNFIENRVKRAEELKDFVPNVTAKSHHMYSYRKVEGKVFSEVVTIPLFAKLLNHCKTFWKTRILDTSETERFKKSCLSFYRDKTFQRINLFYNNCSKQDKTEAINGEAMPRLNLLLEKIDWNWISDGLPGRFHGDFHFENILWNQEGKGFTFLDWRQDFGGDLKTGDIYYDFAKLLHGLIVSHELVAKGCYKIVWDTEDITFDLHRRQMLVECQTYLERWLEIEDYDVRKVRVLTALIFLNIAALHHYPYSLFLYGLGKSMLKKEINA